MPATPRSVTRYPAHSGVLMPMSRCWLSGRQLPPCSETNSRRTASQTGSESTRTPSRSKTTASTLIARPRSGNPCSSGRRRSGSTQRRSLYGPADIGRGQDADQLAIPQHKRPPFPAATQTVEQRDKGVFGRRGRNLLQRTRDVSHPGGGSVFCPYLFDRRKGDQPGEAAIEVMGGKGGVTVPEYEAF